MRAEVTEPTTSSLPARPKDTKHDGWGKDNPLSGEPADIAQLFSAPNFTGDSELDQRLVALMNRGTDAYADHVATGSRYLDWQRTDQEVQRLLAENFASLVYDPDEIARYSALQGLDPNPTAKQPRPVDIHPIEATRFAAAYCALKNQVARVVTVTLGSFDTHGESHHPRASVAATLLTQLIKDVARLPNETMVLVMSDFDRTPQYNAAGGTDHYAIGPVLFAGRGVPTGIIETTDARRADIWHTVLTWLGAAPPLFPRARDLFAS